METEELVIDDEYLKNLSNTIRLLGQYAIDTMIKDYIIKLEEIKEVAIMEGAIAEALEGFISQAHILEKKASDYGYQISRLVELFLEEVEEADQYMF